MSVICSKLENLEKVISEMKETQKEDMIEIRFTQIAFMEKIEKITLNSAKYPTPDGVADSIRKIERHDTFFSIIWVALAAAWALLIFLADKLWQV